MRGRGRFPVRNSHRDGAPEDGATQDRQSPKKVGWSDADADSGVGPAKKLG